MEYPRAPTSGAADDGRCRNTQAQLPFPLSPFDTLRQAQGALPQILPVVVLCLVLQRYFVEGIARAVNLVITPDE